MAISPAGSPISLNTIRAELGILAESNLSLNTAEDGLYVPINPCSTFKPAVPNPAAISEWYGYNHTQPCVSYRYNSVSCETSTGICNVPFSPSQANSNVVMKPNFVFYPIPDGFPNTWLIENAELFPNARFRVGVSYGSSFINEVVYDYTGPYVPWNGIANVGSLSGQKVPASIITGAIAYYFRIDYNDGSGRILGDLSINTPSFLYIFYPTFIPVGPGPDPGGYYDPSRWTSPFSYSATSQALACSGTSYENFTFNYPLSSSSILMYPDESLVTGKAGYYKIRSNSTWIYINNDGLVVSRGIC
jgi:hypothetical protein